MEGLSRHFNRMNSYFHCEIAIYLFIFCSSFRLSMFLSEFLFQDCSESSCVCFLVSFFSQSWNIFSLSPPNSAGNEQLNHLLHVSAAVVTGDKTALTVDFTHEQRYFRLLKSPLKANVYSIFLCKYLFFWNFDRMKDELGPPGCISTLTY